MIRINILKNLPYGEVRGTYNEKEYDFTFTYVQKNSKETTYLVCSSEGYNNYWYLKVTHVEYNDDGEIIYIDVEDKILTDFTFYKIIDKTTKGIKDFACCLSEELDFYKNFHEEKDYQLKSISKDEFWKLQLKRMQQHEENTIKK